jgi:hypothetical protein
MHLASFPNQRRDCKDIGYTGRQSSLRNDHFHAPGSMRYFAQNLWERGKPTEECAMMRGARCSMPGVLEDGLPPWLRRRNDPAITGRGASEYI